MNVYVQMESGPKVLTVLSIMHINVPTVMTDFICILITYVNVILILFLFMIYLSISPALSLSISPSLHLSVSPSLRLSGSLPICFWVNVCTCTNGTGSMGKECLDNGSQKCSKCSEGFHLNAANLCDSNHILFSYTGCFLCYSFLSQ